MNILPVDMDVVEWCNVMVDELIQFGQAPKIHEESQWVFWADAVLLLPGVAAFNPPNPHFFNDWRVWADAFNLAVIL